MSAQNIKYTYNDKYVNFYFTDSNDNIVAFENWDTDNEAYSLLQEAIENGSGHMDDNKCHIPMSHIVRYNDIERFPLNLPDRMEWKFLIDTDGIPNKTDYQFKLKIYDTYPYGKEFRIDEIKGAFIRVEDSEFLLTEDQYKAYQYIDEFNRQTDEEKKNRDAYFVISELKKMLKGSVTLSNELTNVEVFVPFTIRLDMQNVDGQMVMTPIIEKYSEQFAKNFKQYSFKNHYRFMTEEGNWVRIYVSVEKEIEYLKKQKAKKENKEYEEEFDKQIEILRKIDKAFRTIKENEEVDTDKVNDMLQHPEKYFDDDIFVAAGDYNSFMEYFSDRVLDIGLYKPKFQAFISPYKSEWLPGFVIDGNVKILVKNKTEYYELEKLTFEARENNQPEINFKNRTFPTPTDEILAEIKNLLEKDITPGDGTGMGNSPIDKDQKQVLIIEENIELNGYFTENGNAIEEIEHKLYEINNLRSDFSLKDHQKEGVAWLQSLYENQFSGALLADDMGLGKTLQLLYFIEWHAQKTNEEKPYLIVAPVSLLENWENEYQKFFSPPSLPIKKLYGNIDLYSGSDMPEKNQDDAKKLQKKQIILTNYETLRTYQLSLGMVDFAIIALDEAQKIKTPGTLVTNAAKALKADFKLAMTGTPVENSLVDIWCIFDFAIPGLLGSAKDFASEFQKPLKEEDLDIQKHTEKLRNRIGIFLKRRLKKDAAKDLPIKHDDENSVIKEVMPSIQLMRYNETLENYEPSKMLNTLHSLKAISDHPYIINKKVSEYSAEELISTSAKLKVTMRILDDIKQKNEKVIIFAERKETQRILQKVCKERYHIQASIINGDTPTTQSESRKAKLSRQTTIDRFHDFEGFNIIIMSPLAAGVGLNVIGANHVIHYSRHWNPAKEEQATDRAYRIGQTKDVFVYYPMAIFPTDKDEKTNPSFDETLNILLSNKKNLASNALFPTEQIEVSSQDIAARLFQNNTSVNVDNSSVLSMDEINRLNGYYFEAFIACLYQKMGYDVRLTSRSGDKGADVFANSDKENLIIQVKHSVNNLISNSAVQEIVTAKEYYSNLHNKDYKAVVITNSDYPESVRALAKSTKVTLLNKDFLEEKISQYPVTEKECNNMETQRR